MSNYYYPEHIAAVVQFFLKEDGTYDIHALWTVRANDRRGYSQYDVDYCKRDRQYMFHMSGGGPFPVPAMGLYWTTDASLVTEEPSTWSREADRERNPTKRLDNLPIDIGRYTDFWDWLANTCNEAESVYCSICKDSFPGDDLCAHVWWCDEIGGYQGSDMGTDNPDGIAPCDCEDCRRGKQDRARALEKAASAGFREVGNRD
jgi:hypothetical protein